MTPYTGTMIEELIQKADEALDIMGTRGIPLNQEILPGVREIDLEEFRHGDL